MTIKNFFFLLIMSGLLLTTTVPVIAANTSAFHSEKLHQSQGASGVDLDSFYDNFNDNSIDSNLWNSGAFESIDPLVTVQETNNQLVITPRTGQSGLHYNGLISDRSYNLTQGSIFVEVVEIAQSQADTMFTFGTDNNNKIIMETENDTVYMRLVVAGTAIGDFSMPYNPDLHRWWRIRHEKSNDSIRFETSADGLTWTQRHSVSRGSLDITSAHVSLSAGTWNSLSNPGQVVFDNLSWHPLVPNKGDWMSQGTAIAPNPNSGAWDHILWGAAGPSTMVKFNGTYFLYYIGAEGDTGDPEYNPIRRSLGVATSTNGVNFTKYGSNPIITYTTTSGTVVEEGIGGATAIVVGNTIHLYYAAIRSTGGQTVDLDIRYRSSQDGYNFTNDTLIYRSSGDEYSPLGAIYDGSTWSVYIKGPLNKGVGAISRLSGTSPTNLSTKTSVTSTTFGSGGNADYIGDNIFVMHFDRREPTEDRFQVRVMNENSPDTFAAPLFNYTFGSYSDYATPATFKDNDTGQWFMYNLDLTSSTAVISVRTYTPSQALTPEATPSPTPFPTTTTAPSATITKEPPTPTMAISTSTATPNKGVQNLALNKPVTVSSDHKPSPGSLAVDGDASSFWETQKSVGKNILPAEWIVIDLGIQSTINSFVLEWDDYYATAYTIEVSTNNANWTEVFRTVSGDGGIDSIDSSIPSVRYVRLSTTAWNDAAYRVWLREFRVYGTLQ